MFYQKSKKETKKKTEEPHKKKKKPSVFSMSWKSRFWNSNQEWWTPGAWNPDFEIRTGGIGTEGPR